MDKQQGTGIMDFDTGREVRFESMRKRSLSSQILRRHEDLRTRCEREIKIYDKSKRMLAAEMKHSQTIFKEKLRKLHVNSCKSKTGENTEDTKQGQFTRTSRTISLNDSRRQPSGLNALKDDVFVNNAQKSSHLTTLQEDVALANSRFKFLFSVTNVNGRDKYIRKEP